MPAPHLCTLGCPPPPKTLFWPCKLASKYKVTCHVRNALTKDGGSPLSFGPSHWPPKRSATPILGPKSPNCTRLIVCSFESSCERKRYAIFTMLYYQYFFLQIRPKNKVAVQVVLFTMNVFRTIANRAFSFINVCLSGQEFSNEHTMSSVRQF